MLAATAAALKSVFPPIADAVEQSRRPAAASPRFPRQEDCLPGSGGIGLKHARRIRWKGEAILMSTALLTLLFIAAQPADGPVIPAFFTGERLYEICTGEDSAHCWMYVAGVLDGVFEMESASDKRSLCPTRLTNRDAATRVTEFLRENPQFRSRAAAVGVKEALRSELPCDEDRARSP